MSDAPIESRIARWRRHLRDRPAVERPDVEELEGHLRDQMADLEEAGLSPDEAFLVAIQRMGSLDAISREFAREHAERLWKQLAAPPPPPSGTSPFREAWAVLGFAVLGALLVKLPELFGIRLDDDGGPGNLFHVRNFSVLVFPMVAAYFAWKRGLGRNARLGLAGGFAAAAIAANIHPFAPDADTQGLLALHLPIAVWLAVGFAYTGGRWFSGGGRMDFVRFSGELFIYMALIAMGGIVVTVLTALSFAAIGIDVGQLIGRFVIPCGIAGALVVASGLVELKKSVVENMAPVLARIFTPLLAAALLAFLAAMLWTGNPIDIDRDVLILFDLLLVLVAGLLLYNVSARDPLAPPGFFDGLALLLAVSALAVDLLALGAILGRISEFGFTPNRVAALGENLVLLGSLAGSAFLYARFLRSGDGFRALERWQLSYLLVYAGWAALVVVAFPPLFGFR